MEVDYVFLSEIALLCHTVVIALVSRVCGFDLLPHCLVSQAHSGL
jgi:hypothetical protein